MIIKSMSRKAPTFTQLIEYIGRNADPETGTVFARNLYHSGHDAQAVAGQFLDNYRYLPKRKNGNALYHEVIVLEEQVHLQSNQVVSALHDLAERYCELRAPHQLVWGRVHQDTDFPHIHLMISANAVRSDRRVRMDRKYFANVQEDLEVWREANFPEMNQRTVYRQQQPKETPKIVQIEGEMVRRERKPSAKQAVFRTLQPIFEQAQSREELERSIRSAGYEIYQRGKSWGVIVRGTGQRHRLQTLGLMPAFERVLGRNSAPSQHDQSDLSPKTRPDRDARAADLLKNREALAAQARELLDGFDRDEDDGR